MEILVIILLVGAAVWWIRATNKREEEQREAANAATQKQAAADYIEYISATSEGAARQHIHVLWTKWKQLCYTDHYGNIVDDAWHRELRYFVTTVLEPKLYLQFCTKDEDLEYAASVVASEVTLYDLEMDDQADDVATGQYDAEMSGRNFELLVEEVLRSCGADVRRTPSTGDQGVDLLIEYEGTTIAVQCKRCASSVGNKAVQEVSAGRSFYAVERAWVVSDASFTKAARQLASSLGVDLVHYLGLRQHLQRVTT